MVAWAGDERIALVLPPRRAEGEDMAGKLVGAVLDRIEAGEAQGLGAVERLVLVALAETANVKDAEARLSTRRLARRTGFSQSSVVRALKALQSAMWITRVRSADGPCAARYSLNLVQTASEPSRGLSKRTTQATHSEPADVVNHPDDSERTIQMTQTEPSRVVHIPSTPSPPNCEAEFGGARKLEGDAALRSALEAGSAPRPDSSRVNGSAATPTANETVPINEPAKRPAADQPRGIDMRIGLASKAIREHLYAGGHEFDHDFGEDVAVLDDFMRPAGLDGAEVAVAIAELAERHRLAPCSFQYAVAGHATELRELVARIANRKPTTKNVRLA